MAESKGFSHGTDSKSASSATASVTPSRGAEGRRGSASSTKSSSSAKSKGSVERKKRKQRKAPATDQAGNEANVQPPQKADDKPTAEPPAGTNPQEDEEAPAAASSGLPPDVTLDSVLHPMAPTSLSSESTRVAMSDTSLSKTPATEPLDTNQEVTGGLIVPWVPQTEPPIPQRAAAPEGILQNPSTSETLDQPCDDEHQVMPQLPPVPSGSVPVPKVPEWSLQRPSKRVFRAGQKVTLCTL
nr:serine protease filzig-like [Dermacentor andersoni]